MNNTRRKFLTSLFASAWFPAMCSTIKSSLAAKKIVLDKAEDSYVGADAYVQDGLVALYDGIENFDWGIHDNTYVGMRNLCGNGCDLDNVQNGYIVDNCILADDSSNDKCKIFSSDKSTLIVTNFLNRSKAYTHEYCGFGIGLKNGLSDIGFSTGNISGSYYRVYNNSSYGRGSIYVLGAGMILPSGWITNGALGDGFASHSRCADLYSGRNYINGVLKQTGGGADFRYATSTYMRLTNISFMTGGKMFSGRIYDRTLSDEEVAYNYEIDRMRFG